MRFEHIPSRPLAHQVRGAASCGAALPFLEHALRAGWVVLDGVGHCPQLDVPLETAQLILGKTGG